MSNPLANVGHFSADVSTSGVSESFAADAMLGVAGSSYDALNPDDRRKSVSSQVRHEDTILTSDRRERLFNNGLDLWRNWVLFQWVLRKHLDYNTLFDFHACNKDKGLNRDLEFLMERDSRAGNCDIGGRHDWNQFRRLSEVLSYIAGDSGLLTLASGHLQGIESHVIRNPTRFWNYRDRKHWVNGVKLGRMAVSIRLPNVVCRRSLKTSFFPQKLLRNSGPG